VTFGGQITDEVGNIINQLVIDVTVVGNNEFVYDEVQ